MQHVFIIAEAGVNHNGDLAIARQLIDGAVAAGADAVKFQTFSAHHLASVTAKKAGYQVENTGTNEPQVEMLKALELTHNAHQQLIAYCRSRSIQFMSSAFDLPSIELLVAFKIGVWKIPSGEVTNLPYLRRIGSLKQRVLLSTGMATLDEVKEAVEVLQQSGTQKEYITVFHCHTDYPTQMRDVNLRAMVTMRDRLGVRVGYSDHTMGSEIAIAAVALGAEAIEKHITLDRGMSGPDHKASLEPNEFASMVTSIRHVEEALGDGVKQPTERERVLRDVARKSIIASRTIAYGEVFSEKNVTTKRPGTGVSPMRWDSVIGQTAKRDFSSDELIVI